MSDSLGETQQFYTRWARLYDLGAVYTPGIGSLRRAAVDHLAPARGDTVVEMGCGTGANLPLLRDRVVPGGRVDPRGRERPRERMGPRDGDGYRGWAGPREGEGPPGRVVGVDLSRGVLSVARRRIARNDWDHVHVVRGDATRPPIGHAAGDDSDSNGDSEIDCVFASLVSGMVGDPAAMIDTWADLVGPGGRIGLFDLARSSRRLARPLNGLFRRFVTTANPRSVRQSAAPLATLDRRVAAAHRRLQERCVDADYETRALGFARMSAGTVQ